MLHKNKNTAKRSALIICTPIKYFKVLQNILYFYKLRQEFAQTSEK